MSALLIAAAASGAFWVMGDHVDKNNQKLAEQQKAEAGKAEAVSRELYTGRYGDFKDIAEATFDQTQIATIKVDRDLSGVPCRWIEMQNGAVYRTYDMEFPQKQ